MVTVVSMEKIDTTVTKAFSLTYTIVRGTGYRTGTMMVSTNSGSSDLTYTEDFVENTGHYQGVSTLGSPGTGVSLSVSQTSNTVNVQYTSNNSINGTMTYSITHLA